MISTFLVFYHKTQTHIKGDCIKHNFFLRSNTFTLTFFHIYIHSFPHHRIKQNSRFIHPSLAVPSFRPVVYVFSIGCILQKSYQSSTIFKLILWNTPISIGFTCHERQSRHPVTFHLYFRPYTSTSPSRMAQTSRISSPEPHRPIFTPRCIRFSIGRISHTSNWSMMPAMTFKLIPCFSFKHSNP